MLMMLPKFQFDSSGFSWVSDSSSAWIEIYSEQIRHMKKYNKYLTNLVFSVPTWSVTYSTYRDNEVSKRY